MEEQVIDHREIYEECSNKYGNPIDLAIKSTYNPKTKKYYGFSDSFVPDPVNYRKKNVAKRLAAIAKLAFNVIPQVDVFTDNGNRVSVHRPADRSAHVTAHIQHLFAAAGLGDNLIFIHDETIACR